MKLALAILLSLCSVSYGGNRVIRQAVVQNIVVADTGLVIAPFALPIGTPVAIAHPSYYSYQGQAQAYGQQAQPQAQAQPATYAEFEEFLRWRAEKQGRAVTTQSAPPTAVQTSCLSCHSGEGAKKGFRLDQPITADQRLLAVRRVALGEMPPKKPLPAGQAGLVIAELSTVPPVSAPSVSTQDVPPDPVPPSEPKP